MTPKEKYNTIVYAIEDMVNDTNNYYENSEIIKLSFQRAQCGYLDEKGRNIVFNYLNGMSVLDYVKERRMARCYAYIFECDSWSQYKDFIDNKSNIKFCDDAAFINKFKKAFGMPPRQAFLQKNKVLLPPIRDWDFVNINGKGDYVVFERDGENTETRFGISKQQYMKAEVAANLQSLYGLSENASEFAYNLSVTHEFDMEKAFEYVHDFINDDEKRESKIENTLLDDRVLKMYFEYDMPFNEIVCVLAAIKQGLADEIKIENSKEYISGIGYYYLMNGEIKNSQMFETKYGKLKSYDEIFDYFYKNSNNQYTLCDFKLFVCISPFYGFEEAMSLILPGDTEETDIYEVLNAIPGYIAFDKEKLNQLYKKPLLPEDLNFSPEELSWVEFSDNKIVFKSRMLALFPMPVLSGGFLTVVDVEQKIFKKHSALLWPFSNFEYSTEPLEKEEKEENDKSDYSYSVNGHIRVFLFEMFKLDQSLFVDIYKRYYTVDDSYTELDYEGKIRCLFGKISNDFIYESMENDLLHCIFSTDDPSYSIYTVHNNYDQKFFLRNENKFEISVLFRFYHFVEDIISAYCNDYPEETAESLQLMNKDLDDRMNLYKEIIEDGYNSEKNYVLYDRYVEKFKEISNSKRLSLFNSLNIKAFMRQEYPLNYIRAQSTTDHAPYFEIWKRMEVK